MLLVEASVASSAERRVRAPHVEGVGVTPPYPRYRIVVQVGPVARTLTAVLTRVGAGTPTLNLDAMVQRRVRGLLDPAPVRRAGGVGPLPLRVAVLPPPPVVRHTKTLPGVRSLLAAPVNPAHPGLTDAMPRHRLDLCRAGIAEAQEALVVRVAHLRALALDRPPTPCNAAMRPR